MSPASAEPERPGPRRQPAGTAETEVGKATVGTDRLGALTVLLGVLIALMSQFVTGYSLVDETDSVITTVTLYDTHGLVTTAFAVVAALALVFAVANGSRSAVAVVIAMGIGIVLVFLIVDLPDVGETGFFISPGVGNIDASGKGSAGLWMELVGGLVILLGGAALARLDESRLKAIRPSAAAGSGGTSGPDRPESSTDPERPGARDPEEPQSSARTSPGHD